MAISGFWGKRGKKGGTATEREYTREDMERLYEKMLSTPERRRLLVICAVILTVFILSYQAYNIYFLWVNSPQ